MKFNDASASDHAIAKAYVAFLVAEKLDDGHAARAAFCEHAGVAPKLLYSNPHIAGIASLFAQQTNVERVADMTVREYLRYHYYYIHQAYKYGIPEMQQTWLGHHIIKSPADCWAYQELIWRQKPDIVLELGVMFGGASVFFAHVLELIGHGQVLGIDISLKNLKHKPKKGGRITYLEGDSGSKEMLDEVARRCKGKSVLVIADSDHEKEHVLKELRLYSRFVRPGGYYVVEDTLNDLMGFHPVPNEGPLAAARQFLAETKDFEIDRRLPEKYLMSLSPDGFLRRKGGKA
ncbi:MAG: class I SAM-dependent methyltransferase [Proteobacteria bacterium]|nr:class I SAM-dependent methyltransferase [Pseudomonadota bacterium]